MFASNPLLPTRGPTERNLPPTIDRLLPAEAAAYIRLRDIERRLDATVARKRLDYEQLLASAPKRTGKLRITVSSSWVPAGAFGANGSVDQAKNVDSSRPAPTGAPARTTTKTAKTPPSQGPAWTLRVQGQLVHEPTQRRTPNQRPVGRFSQFLRQLTVEVDLARTAAPANTMPPLQDRSFAEYTRATSCTGQPQTDVLEITRAGDNDVPVLVKIRLDHGPDYFKLAPDLAALLGGTSARTCGPISGLAQMRSKRQVVLELWQYIKHNGLVDREDRRIIICDAPLQAIFGVDRVLFPQIPDLINRYLFAPDAEVIPYTIRAVPQGSPPVSFDVDVEVEDTQVIEQLAHAISEIGGIPVGKYWLPQDEKKSDSGVLLRELDERISESLFELNTMRLKHDFMKCFAGNPSGYATQLVATYRRDMDTIIHGGVQVPAASAMAYESRPVSSPPFLVEEEHQGEGSGDNSQGKRKRQEMSAKRREESMAAGLGQFEQAWTEDAVRKYLATRFRVS